MPSTQPARRALVIAALAFFGCRAPAPVPEEPVPRLFGSGVASIDGTIDGREWANAATLTLGVRLPAGGAAPATLYLMNDAESLYVALRYPLAALERDVYFNVTLLPAPGVVQPEDHLTVNVLDYGRDAVFQDAFVLQGMSVPAQRDVDAGGTENGRGAFGARDGWQSFELSHPLRSADPAHDATLRPGELVRFCLALRLGTAYTAACPAGELVIAGAPPGGAAFPSQQPWKVVPRSASFLP